MMQGHWQLMPQPLPAARLLHHGSQPGLPLLPLPVVRCLPAGPAAATAAGQERSAVGWGSEVMLASACCPLRGQCACGWLMANSKQASKQARWIMCQADGIHI